MAGFETYQMTIASGCCLGRHHIAWLYMGLDGRMFIRYFYVVQDKGQLARRAIKEVRCVVVEYAML